MSERSPFKVRVFVKAVVFVLLMLPCVSCSLIHPIPELRFQMDPSMKDHEIEILSMSHGSFSNNSASGAEANIGVGVTTIKLRITGDGKESVFEAEVHAERSIQGVGWRVPRLSHFGGSMWLPEQTHDVFVFSGAHSTAESFLVGEAGSRKIGMNNEIPISIQAHAPGVETELGPAGMRGKGNHGTSLLIMFQDRYENLHHDTLEFRGAPGSTIQLWQGAERQNILLDESGKATSNHRHGLMRFRWIPPGKTHAEIEVVVDCPPLTAALCIFSFSSNRR
ncbi:MAG: hypothetical protein ACI97A_003250 [Planctomycetota bacterium]|jgi:hypothetical protein